MRRVLVFPTVRIAAVSGDATNHRWIAEFFSPIARIVTRGRADVEVALELDDESWSALEARGRHPSGRMDVCFYLDTRIVSRPRWRGPRHTRVVRDDEFDVFYVIDRRVPRVTVVGRRRDRLARLAWMRVIREMMMARSIDADRLIAHGAAFAVGERGVLIAGAKRAGKSTVLIHALGMRGARYVANDRAVLHANGRSVNIQSMPTIASLRTSSIARFPEIEARLRSRGYFPALTLGEARRRPMGDASPWRQRFTLTPKQLCRLLDVEALPVLPLGVIVFPRLTGRRGVAHVHRLSPSRAAGALRANLFRARARRKTGGVFAALVSRRPVSRATTVRLSERIGASVPAYDVHLGRDGYTDHEWLTRLA